ncbi:pinensin family lanthipeptide [Roseivirga sp. BDSF3-8]|uniref:pinensin family lanthipeptide n=1 Tax=Roseivirga sp. BDSF3-8 TaxID=3241598 RepID=UPI003532793C
MKKLKLNELEVASFVTNSEKLNEKTVKGGATALCGETITVYYGTCNIYPCRQIP